MKISKIFLLILLANQVFGQSFTTSAKISGIKNDGLHSVLLRPEIRSFSKADLSDLRIFDKENHEVPYLVLNEKSNKPADNFEAFPMVLKEIIPSKKTTIIIENIGNKNLEEITLNLANSSLTKSCNISGSDDQKTWFGLLDKFQLRDLENTEKTNTFLKIKLPLSSYHFLKFELNDLKTAPINILQIGNFKHLLLNSIWQNLRPDSVKITNDLQQKKTQIKVFFAQKQVIDKVFFEISKPNFYQRNASILVNRKIVRKKKAENLVETLVNFTLNSSQKNAFDLPEIFEKEFIIEIDNEDNLALEILAVKLQQLSAYLVADLKINENYTLKTGNEELKMPNYDLAFFKNNISKQLPEAAILEVKTIATISEKKEISFWQNPWFMWLCITIGGSIIFYFSSDLLKDMQKNKM